MGTTSVLSVTTSLRCAAAGQPGVAMSTVERLFTQAAVVGEGAQLSTLTLLRIPPPVGRSIVAGLKAASAGPTMWDSSATVTGRSSAATTMVILFSAPPQCRGGIGAKTIRLDAWADSQGSRSVCPLTKG